MSTPLASFLEGLAGLDGFLVFRIGENMSLSRKSVPQMGAAVNNYGCRASRRAGLLLPP